ncbi:ABC transporter ATP-binding protein (plasmid) [Sorangium sp. So ce119]|uniref:ABC transporter ATP-binding protein n=1 Tax=Sorangium sp. So ce119 TaxID=3133279 RepID=UPI003F613704
MKWTRTTTTVLVGLHELETLAYPFVAGLLVERLVERDWRGFLASTLVLLTLPILESALYWGRETGSFLWSESRGAQLRRRLLQHLLRVPYLRFLQSRTGDLLNRCIEDVRLLTEQDRLNLEGFRSALAIAAMAVLLATQHWLLVLTVLGNGAIYLLESAVLTPHVRALFGRSITQLDRSNEYLRERLEILPLTRFSGSIAWELQQYEKIQRDGLVIQRRQALLNLIVRAVAGATLALNALLVYAVSGFLLVRGEISLGSLVISTAYMLRIAMASSQLFEWYRKSVAARLCQERTQEVLDMPEEGQLDAAGEVERLETLELQSLGFAYPDRPRVLTDVSMTLERGEIVALVGTSGSGKSTLVDLILGLHPVQEGRVIMNGSVALEELNIGAWRRRIAFASQFPYFFSDTVAYNLCYGRPSLSPAALEQMAERFGVHELILRRAEGYRTRIVAQAGFSGGQRQRLGLVRTCMVEDPLLIILDEPTSALDSMTERRVMEIIAELKARAPVLLIAHRLSTVMYADRVVVLHEGRVVEQGTHVELIRAKGRYAELYGRELAYAQGLAARGLAAQERSAPVAEGAPGGAGVAAGGLAR